MRDRKFGRVINISSINGQKGQAGQANYSAAKAGDLGFTKALAQEGARAGITVNAICPGYIGTEMVRAIDEKVLNERIIPQIPVGRLGEPEEIARCVVFLASTTPASSPARRAVPCRDRTAGLRQTCAWVAQRWRDQHLGAGRRHAGSWRRDARRYFVPC
jgi:NAD(P)-dependent dehydrogenase (short-subunit alcohol dehydrogenase family)